MLFAPLVLCVVVDGVLCGVGVVGIGAGGGGTCVVGFVVVCVGGLGFVVVGVVCVAMVVVFVLLWLVRWFIAVGA